MMEKIIVIKEVRLASSLKKACQMLILDISNLDLSERRLKYKEVRALRDKLFKKRIEQYNKVKKSLDNNESNFVIATIYDKDTNTYIDLFNSILSNKINFKELEKYETSQI